jgi:hypothetical protein
MIHGESIDNSRLTHFRDDIEKKMANQEESNSEKRIISIRMPGTKSLRVLYIL